VTPTGGLILNLVLVAEFRPGLDAVSVYALPGVLTLRSLKVAMPFCGVILNVPLKAAELAERLS
jgi:hypothetical protein